MHALDFFFRIFFWFGVSEEPGPTATEETDDPNRGTKPQGG